MDCNLSNEERPSCSTTSNNDVTKIKTKTTAAKNKVLKKKTATGRVHKKRVPKKRASKKRTTISVTKFFIENEYFYNLCDYLPWESQPLDEEGFCCDSTVIETNLKEYLGITMELFIRKYLCNKLNIKINDYNCKKVLENEILELELRERLQDSYDVYTDPETNAIDIIDEIKTIALSNRVCFKDIMENINDADNMIINESNIIHICKFLDTLKYENMVFKKFLHLKLNNVTLRGLADYIFDDHVFYQIVTSENFNAFKYKGMKVLFYILSHYYTKYYGDQLSKSYTIIIYNPLLCFTHTAEIIITPDLFDVVKDCIEQAVDGETVDFDKLFE